MDEDMRVEQLAAAVGVPVDTVRYYQSRGLLDPPRREGRVAWYGAGHRERLVRIRELQAQGLTLATIGRLLRGELDASDEALVKELTAAPSAGRARTDPAASGVGAPVDGTAPSGGRPDDRRRPGGAPESSAPPGATDGSTFTLAQLAERTGVPLALLKAVEAEDLLIPRRVGTTERYTVDDVAAARAGLLLLEHGIPLGELLDLARRHHAATEHTVKAAVDLFATYIREPLRGRAPGSGPAGGGESTGPGTGTGGTGTQEDHTAALLEAYTSLLPAVTDLVGHHFSRALTRAALARLEGDGTPAERQLADGGNDSPLGCSQASELAFSIESHALVDLEGETLVHDQDGGR